MIGIHGPGQWRDFGDRGGTLNPSYCRPRDGTITSSRPAVVASTFPYFCRPTTKPPAQSLLWRQDLSDWPRAVTAVAERFENPLTPITSNCRTKLRCQTSMPFVRETGYTRSMALMLGHRRDLCQEYFISASPSYGYLSRLD